jgi:hypothetical protein
VSVARIAAAELQRTLDRFRAAVAEEDPIRPRGVIDQCLRQFDRRTRMVQVRQMDQSVGVIPDCARNGWRFTCAAQRSGAASGASAGCAALVLKSNLATKLSLLTTYRLPNILPKTIATGAEKAEPRKPAIHSLKEGRQSHATIAKISVAIPAHTVAVITDAKRVECLS